MTAQALSPRTASALVAGTPGTAAGALAPHKGRKRPPVSLKDGCYFSAVPGSPLMDS